MKHGTMHLQGLAIGLCSMLVLPVSTAAEAVRLKKSIEAPVRAYTPTPTTSQPQSNRTKMAFVKGVFGDAEIYIMNADGTAQTKLTSMVEKFPNGNVWARPGFPSLSPDGTKIAFTRMWSENNPPIPYGEIYVMNVNGTNLIRLSSDIRSMDEAPAWSPDGTRIAFASWRDRHADGTGNLEIYVMNANGTGQRRLTNSPGIDNSPCWSPDGTRIAFSSYRSGNMEIYVMNADGTGVTNLSNNPAGDYDPDWSPSGANISFTSNRSGKPEVYTMNANGTGQRQLTNYPTEVGGADWSPDGSKIVFHRFGAGLAPDPNEGLYTMNPDGTGQTKIAVPAAVNGAYISYPSW